MKMISFKREVITIKGRVFITYQHAESLFEALNEEIDHSFRSNRTPAQINIYGDAYGEI